MLLRKIHATIWFLMFFVVAVLWGLLSAFIMLTLTEVL